MNHVEMLKILLENYSPTELEDRLDLTLYDLKDGLMNYIEDNEVEVAQMLMEDLWL